MIENVRQAYIFHKPSCTSHAMARAQVVVHPAYTMEQRPKHYLRAWRKHRDLTLEQVAERAGTTHATLSRVERGVHPYNQALLELLADIYNTDPASLLMRDPGSPEAIFSIWDQLEPAAKSQVVEIAKTFRKAG